ncbi:hypothetical protein PRIPAC_78715, partial [Pristionchus pacificus]|uniref:CWH43-like N-terminal domain-containing protein n=1 Tax=Pristionchus pacificus TaxID=54126 RepID=A0A2A6CAP2_PRIPA
FDDIFLLWPSIIFGFFQYSSRSTVFSLFLFGNVFSTNTNPRKVYLSSSYSISAWNGHAPPRWPYLNEISRYPPESSIHSMMINHIAILFSIWVYLKHREILSYLSQSNPLGPQSYSRSKAFSFITMLIGVWAAFSLQISANFPSHKIKSIEGWANLSTNLSISIYITFHSIISLLVVDPSIPRKGSLSHLLSLYIYLGIFLVRISLVMAVVSFSASLLNTLMVTGSTVISKEDSSLGAISEWAVYYSLALYLLTDSYEFRCLSISALKLIIPGSQQFAEIEESRSRSDTYASDFDPRVSYLNDPLIR